MNVNQMEDNTVQYSFEQWARQLSFLPSTFQSTLIFQKLQSDPKMRVYMDIITKYVRPKTEASIIHKTYIYGLLKNGSFKCKNPPTFSIKTKQDVDLYSKYKRMSNIIMCYHKIKNKNSSDVVKQLKKDFDIKISLVTKLFQYYCFSLKVDGKHSVIDSNINKLKLEFNHADESWKRLNFRRVCTREFNNFMLETFKDLDHLIKIQFSVSVKELVLKSPLETIHILTESQQNLNKSIKFLEYESVSNDIKDCLFMLPLAVHTNIFHPELRARVNTDTCTDTDNQDLSITEENYYDGRIMRGTESILLLQEELKCFAESINENLKFNACQYSDYFNTVKALIDSKRQDIHSTIKLCLNDTSSFHQTVSAFSEKISQELQNKDSVIRDPNQLRLANKSLVDIDLIFYKWNTSINDINVVQVIENKVLFYQVITKIISDSKSSEFSCSVVLEKNNTSKLIELQSKIEQITELCRILNAASDQCKEIKQTIFKYIKEIKFLKIDGTPMNELKQKLIKCYTSKSALSELLE